MRLASQRARRQERAAGGALVPADVFKDPYSLDFLGLEDTYSERDLEAAILRNSECFLLELGADCRFVAWQRRLTIAGRGYHLALVLVGLAIGALASADAAQMRRYREWATRHDRREGEEPIGLLPCGSRGEQVVAQYLLPENTAAAGLRGPCVRPAARGTRARQGGPGAGRGLVRGAGRG